MARIKITQTTVCGQEYFNTELIGVFQEEVAIVGGGYTKEEALAELKANAQVWLEYAIEDATVEQYHNGYRVGGIWKLSDRKGE